jgi:hypothetical protein
MIKRKAILLAILIGLSFNTSAQDTTYVRQLIDSLSSEYFFGRGYLKQGGTKAAEYLSDEMKQIGLEPVGDSYLQNFTFKVNTFPADPVLSINGETYRAGYDYVMPSDCPTINGKFPLHILDSTVVNDSLRFCKLQAENYHKHVIVVPVWQIEEKKRERLVKEKIRNNYLKAKAYIMINDRYTIWSVSTETKKAPVFQFTRQAFPDTANEIEIHIKSKMDRTTASNVVGYLPGSSGKTMAFSAHYDHLGGIGENLYYPGAQDNASGVAMCLDIARFYKNNPPEFNVLIMLFAGEEAGLLGSSWYVNKPLYPLDSIDFLINLDMAGTGEKGIAIVNAKDSLYTKEREAFIHINDSLNLLDDIKCRPVSPNSDHFPFHQKGVKSVFIYSRGGETFYHNPADVSSSVSLGGYYDIFELITNFLKSYGR